LQEDEQLIELKTDNDDENDHLAPQYNFDVDTADQATLDGALSEIGIDLSQSVLTPNDRLRLSRLIVKYSDVFAKDMSQLGRTSVYSCKIDTGDSPPQRSRMYRYSPVQKEEIERQVSEMLKNDLIFPSNSLWQSSVVLVRSKHSNKPPRFCVDFRRLNSVTKDLKQVMTSFDDVIDSIGSSRAKIFTVLDFFSGFFQIPLADKESMDRASFVVPSGVYSFKVMPQGIKGGSIVFQSLAYSLFRKMLFKYMLCYTDDVIIYSPDIETHITQHLPELFRTLRKANLKLNSKKSQFATDHCRYLGHIITAEGCKPDPDRLSAIATYPMCKDVTELRRFLGICNYFRRYIMNYSKITHCLTRLLQKDAKWVWTDEHTNAFETVRNMLINAPILAYPDFTKTMHITTDASTVSIGYYLSYFDSNNRERIIAYSGRNLRPNEKNWSICELEGLSIVEAVRQFSVYLSNKFIIHSDNISMQWLKNIKNSKGRLLRWSLLLQSYNFDIIHRRNRNNNVADGLSRRTYEENEKEITYHGPIDEAEIMAIGLADTLDCTEPDNAADADRTGTKRKYTQVTLYYKDEAKQNEQTDDNNSVLDTDTVCTLTDRMDINKLQRECPDVGPIIKYIETNELPTDDKHARRIVLEADRYIIDHGILYKLVEPRRNKNSDSLPTRQLVIPISLRAFVLKSMHDTNFGSSHPGLDRMYANLKQRYTWNGCYIDCYKHVTSCEKCQAAKQSPRSRKAPLMPIPPDGLFHRFHMDYVQLSKGDSNPDQPYNKLLVIVDAYSKWPEAIPVTSELATEAAEVLYREVICRYGAPKVIVSDRGKSFMSKLIAKLCEFFEIERHFTSSFHPQSNSVAERMNQSIIASLRKNLPEDGNWTKVLPGVLAALRAGVNTRSSKYSPYYLLFGKEMRMAVDNVLKPLENASASATECIDDIRQAVNKTRKVAAENIRKEQEKYKAQFDRKASHPMYQRGDLVLLYQPKPPLSCKSPKLYRPYIGPYFIEETHDGYTYTIRDCENQQKYTSRVHANRLKKFISPTERLYNVHKPKSTVKQPRTTQRTMTDETETTTNNKDKNNNEKEWWSVDKVLATRVRNKIREFRVRWTDKRYPSTWVRSEDLSPGLAREYYINKSQKRRKRRHCY
jgi:hypothetical protein